MGATVQHLKPGETIMRCCTCWNACGGSLSDNPDCEMHHGPNVIYIMTVAASSTN